jgi:hypothetical protein
MLVGVVEAPVMVVLLAAVEQVEVEQEELEVETMQLPILVAVEVELQAITPLVQVEVAWLY